MSEWARALLFVLRHDRARRRWKPSEAVPGDGGLSQAWGVLEESEEYQALRQGGRIERMLDRLCSRRDARRRRSLAAAR